MMLTLALTTATWATAQPQPAAHVPAAIPEVRGTWLTTTANDALARPANTAATMRALREIGLNTVYVETWKNGYTQYPSDVLARTIGVSQRPSQAAQDPSDSAAPRCRAICCTRPALKRTARALSAWPGLNTASWPRMPGR